MEYHDGYICNSKHKLLVNWQTSKRDAFRSDIQLSSGVWLQWGVKFRLSHLPLHWLLILHMHDIM